MNCWTMKKLRIGGKKKNAELFENDATSDTINRIVSKKEQVIWFSFPWHASWSNTIYELESFFFQSIYCFNIHRKRRNGENNMKSLKERRGNMSYN